jgi:hypothetical protein
MLAREAIEAAHFDCVVDACTAGSGKDTIVLDYETYGLDRVGAGEDWNLTDDPDIRNEACIQSWTSLAEVDGSETDRVFHVHPEAPLELVNLTVIHGRAEDAVGGGILNQGRTSLDHVWVKDNVSTGSGLVVPAAGGSIRTTAG